MTEAERIIQRLSMEVSVLASQLNEAMRMLEHVGQSACGMAFAASMEIAEQAKEIDALNAELDEYESDDGCGCELCSDPSI